jgi:predicted phosphodiesterase
MRSLRIALVAVGLAALLPACGSDADSSSPTQNPAKSSASRSPATVWAVGDGADGSDRSRRVAEMIERTKPDRLLYLGDVYEDGTQEEFENNYKPVFGRFDSIAAPTPGNHEWDHRAEGYDPYWKSVGLVTNRHYYSFKIAGWEIISLNSESGLEDGSPQRRWLKHRLRRRGTCRIAFWHRPFLNAGRHGDQKDTRPLWRAMQGRAALVLNGHDHNLQHFKRRNGIVQLISGAGGHGLYSSDENDPRLVWDEDDEFGALRLDLRPGVARFRFVALPGRTLHRGKVRCRR